MSTGTRLAGLLLITTSLTLPAVLHAQSTELPAAQAEDEPAAEDNRVDGEDQAEQPDISVPGGGIIVTGRRNRDQVRNSSQVINVLSEEDIARSGEGDIAGSLGRVSGLSLVGAGRVFVRGLGDRYSLALLNGLPLPSPEPLSRVVPLDIFPTSVISSALVQKSYSANFPAEFGGGVINLTTKAVPTENFLTTAIEISGDSETTFENGLTYFGSRLDTFGFDNGNRDIPDALRTLINDGVRVNQIPLAEQESLAGQLMPLNLVTLQKNNTLPANFSANLTGGLSFELGGDNYLGIIASAGIRNRWLNRSVTIQNPRSLDPLNLAEDSSQFITDNNVLVNGLLSFGLDIGSHTIRWTNLFIRDTLKTSRLEERVEFLEANQSDVIEQRTAWFERQLLDSQLVAELDFDTFKVDLRGGYAQTDREAPFNVTVPYTRTNNPGDPFGDKFVAFSTNQRSGVDSFQTSFEELREKLWFGGIDLSYALTDNLEVSTGYSYSDTKRDSFTLIIRPSISSGTDLASAAIATGLRRPGDIINGATLALFDVSLTDSTPFPAFNASLEVHAGYGMFRWAQSDRLSIEGGLRFESGTQLVQADPRFSSFQAPVTSLIENDYYLPSGTLTWEPVDDLQLRLSASQTIARPQFRELVEQTYFDPISNRSFRGNPFIEDSELVNLELRAEYYLNRRDRVSLATFFKDIDKPIESFRQLGGENINFISFANAPSATLYGAELDFVYGFDLSGFGGSFFETKQLLVIGNYTYTQSELSVSDTDTVRAQFSGSTEISASQIFDDGSPLVGQSDHVGNLSIGIEDTDKIQQFTMLFNYASKRVTFRGGPLPDVVENPGLTVDLVARSGLKLGGLPVELSAEVRNIFGRDNFEFQKLGDNRAEINTFQVGTSFAIGLKAEF